jgi:hypothetical protein
METSSGNRADTTHTYSRGVGIFVASAQSFGFNPTESQVDEWVKLLGAARLLDDLLDSEKPQAEREEEYDRHVGAMFDRPDNGLPILEPELFSGIRDYSERWSVGKTSKVKSLTENVKEIASIRRGLTSARELGLLGLREGTETARLFEVDSPLWVGEQDFNAWLEALLRFGVVVDTALDLPEDFANCLTKVSPTRKNQLLVARCGMSEVKPLFAKTPANLYWSLAKAAGAVADDTKKDSILRN